MYTVDEIMKMLDTQSQDDLVKEFTTNLNAAARRKAEDKKNAAKVMDADKVMTALVAFLKMYYPEWSKVTVTGKDLVDILDNTKALAHGFEVKLPSLDPIASFLKENKLL